MKRSKGSLPDYVYFKSVELFITDGQAARPTCSVEIHKIITDNKDQEQGVKHKKMNFYRRNLPHWQPHGAEYFVTFRLAGSLPKEAIVKLKRERDLLIQKLSTGLSGSGKLPDLRAKIHKHIFKKYEEFLDEGLTGPTWLAQTEVAEVV